MTFRNLPFILRIKFLANNSFLGKDISPSGCHLFYQFDSTIVVRMIRHLRYDFFEPDYIVLVDYKDGPCQKPQFLIRTP